MLVTLPAGRRGGNKLDAGATARRAPAATGGEARASQTCTQAVPTAGGEGVATAPAKTQASTSNVAATTVAAGNGRCDHG